MTGVLYTLARFCVRRRFVVLAVWALAALSYRFIERPFLRLKARASASDHDRRVATGVG